VKGNVTEDVINLSGSTRIKGSVINGNAINVSGDTRIKGDVGGNAINVSDTLSVKGHVDQNAINVSGDMKVGSVGANVINISGNTRVRNDVDGNAINVSGETKVGGNVGENVVNVSGSTSVKGSVINGSAINVSGDTRIKGDVGGNAINVSDTLSVKGHVGENAVNISGSLKAGSVGGSVINVSGDTRVRNDVGGNAINVSGETRIGGNVGENVVNVSGSTSVKGSVINGSAINISGNTRVRNDVGGNAINVSGETRIGGNVGENVVNVSGSTSVKGNVENGNVVNVSGDTRIKGNVVNGNAINVSDTLSIKGNVGGNAVNVSGATRIGGKVEGNAVNVSGDMNIRRGVGGNAVNVSGNMNVRSGGVGGSATNVSGEMTVRGGVIEFATNVSGLMTVSGGVGKSATNVSGTMTVRGGVNENATNVSGRMNVFGNVGENVTNVSGTTIVRGNVLDGNATNVSGSLRITGFVSDNVFNAGSAHIGGDIGGNVRNFGFLRLGGNVVEGNVSNRGLISLDGDTDYFYIGGNLRNNDTIRFDQPYYSALIVERNLSGSGTFEMRPVNFCEAWTDIIVIGGDASGNHFLDIPFLYGELPKGNEAPVDLVYIPNGTNDATFTSGTFAFGAFMYTATPNEDNSIIQLGKMRGVLSQAGQYILGIPGSQNIMWLTAQDNVMKRMSELRAATELPAWGKDSVNVTVPPLPPSFATKSWLDGFWVRGYGSQSNVKSDATGRAFRARLGGVDMGADKVWQLTDTSLLFTGFFGGYGEARQNFRHNGSDGRSQRLQAGVYATWMHDNGFYTDALVKGAHYQNTFYAYNDNHQCAKGKYNNWGMGADVKLGKKFQFQQGWFAEPMAQVTYARFSGRGYETTGVNVFDVSQRDLDAWQFRAGARFGRSIELPNGGLLQPFVQVGAVEQVSTGGKVQVNGIENRPNLDGVRAEFSTGVLWLVNPYNQLLVDYQAAVGQKYDKPWGFNASYRLQF